MAMTEDEHLAVCFMLDFLTDRLTEVHCPSRVAIVAMKVFIWVSEQAKQEVPKELLGPEDAMRRRMEQFWAETPSNFGQMGHS